MSIRITVVNVTAGKETMRMELEPHERIGEIIECAAEFWNKDPGAYVLKRGKTLLRPNMSVAEENILNDDVLELIPDPEGGC